MSGPGWMNRNATRKYPLDDTASSISDSGNLLPESFIVDANIWVPSIEFAGGRILKYIYIASATVSTGLVSLTIMGNAGPASPHAGDAIASEETPFTPLASVSVLKKDFVPYKNYALTPIEEGVMGWVAFGQLTDSEPFSMLFSGPRQSMLAPKTARFYSTSDTPDIKAGQMLKKLSGDVKIVSNLPLKVSPVLRDIYGYGSTTVLEFSLVGADGESVPNSETLELYAGPCYRRPESRNCTRVPISSVNGVTPDSDGVINVNFTGVTTRVFDDGLCIDPDRGLSQVCQSVAVAKGSIGCSISTPFVDTFSNMDNLITWTDGYFYTDSGKLYVLTGDYSSAYTGTCLETLPSAVTSRVFYVAEDTIATGQTYGLFICDSGSTRVVYRNDGTIIAENKYSEEILATLGTVAAGDPLTAVVTDRRLNGVAIPEDYWDEDGGTGIVVYGDSDLPSSFSEYGVEDD